jgi:hypothetical protein
MEATKTLKRLKKKLKMTTGIYNRLNTPETRRLSHTLESTPIPTTVINCAPSTKNQSPLLLTMTSNSTAVEKASITVVKVFGAVGTGYRLVTLGCCCLVMTAALIAAVAQLQPTILVVIPAVAVLPLIMCFAYFCSLEATLAAIIADRQATGGGGANVVMAGSNALPL